MARISTSEVYGRLREEILAGDFLPGEPMREVALAERFGVSRTPVREALRLLLAEHLVARSGRSLIVHQVSPDEVMQVYDLRIMLEGEAAGQAATSRTEADLARLESLVARDRGLEDPDDRVRMSTNLEFHEAIRTAAHNPILEDLLRRLYSHLIHSPHSTLSVGDRWPQSLAEHAEIVEAIRTHDAESASRLAREHMAEARHLRLQLIREGFAQATQE